MLEDFDAILDGGAASLMADLIALERARIEGEMERFIEGEILPSDF